MTTTTEDARILARLRRWKEQPITMVREEFQVDVGRVARMAGTAPDRAPESVRTLCRPSCRKLAERKAATGRAYWRHHEQREQREQQRTHAARYADATIPHQVSQVR